MFIREEQDACREGQGSYKTRYGSAQMRGTRELDVICLTYLQKQFHKGLGLFVSCCPSRSPFVSCCCCCLVITYCIGISVYLARTSHTSFISIFPPVCRNIAKQTFLETLQDNLIEMDILASARHDASYNDGYVACLLSGSHYSQNLLCHENNSDACAIFPSNILCFEMLSIISLRLLQCQNLVCCMCPFPV